MKGKEKRLGTVTAVECLGLQIADLNKKYDDALFWKHHYQNEFKAAEQKIAELRGIIKELNPDRLPEDAR